MFAWVKTIAGQSKTKYRGLDRVRWHFTLATAAYNLIRLPKLLGAVVTAAAPPARARTSCHQQRPAPTCLAGHQTAEIAQFFSSLLKPPVAELLETGSHWTYTSVTRDGLSSSSR